jgi:hypothetical protein
MADPINMLQDPQEPTSIRLQRIMQQEERKRAGASNLDRSAGELYKNDFATPQLIELGRRYPALLDPNLAGQVPDNIRVQAAELMAVRDAQERIRFQNLVAQVGTKSPEPVEEPTYLARPERLHRMPARFGGGRSLRSVPFALRWLAKQAKRS